MTIEKARTYMLVAGECMRVYSPLMLLKGTNDGQDDNEDKDS